MTDERLAQLRALEALLRYSFRDISLLDNALVHRSFVNENPALSLNDNERLEFLGDAVIGLCTSDLLMKKYPDYTEGQLSKMRASIVNEHSLAKLANKFSLGNDLLLGKGEDLSGGRTKPSILSNAFEALAAAIFLDSDFDAVYDFLKTSFEDYIEAGSNGVIQRDYKTAAQELCQTLFKTVPKYTLANESGPDHDKTFDVIFSVADVISTTGTGRSKKEAEQQAAQKALERLHTENGEQGGTEG
jgi:ribonuclease-3